jgi:hypothetical protein
LGIYPSRLSAAFMCAANPINGANWARCRSSASIWPIGSLRQDRTFIETDVNDRRWSKAEREVSAIASGNATLAE